MIPLYTIMVLAAIVFQAFFTASEMAFTSLNKMKLRAMIDAGDEKAGRLKIFLEKEGAFLGTTLTGTNIAVVITSVLATRIFSEYIGPVAAPLAATLCMVPITLIFAEIVPKMIANQFATDIAMSAFPAVEWFHRIFLPLISGLNGAARIILRPFGRKRSTLDITLTKSDLKNILLMGHETGGVESDEIELIHKVLELGGKTIEKIMVPLYRVSSISEDDSVDNLKRLAAMTGFSRIPVYSGAKNKMVGIVNIYDILFSDNDRGASGISGFIREPVFVNISDSLDIALARLRHREQPMGIVLDKDQEVVGVVTIEDILEEIVGDIRDTG
jgi:putative hemolysin